MGYDRLPGFWECFELNPETSCWVWRFALDDDGYGRVRAPRPGQRRTRIRRVHVVAWERVHGPVPAGLELDHLCRIRACGNPDHLQAVKSKENTLRGEGPTAQNARRTECRRGHPLDGDNLYVNPTTGRRRCRICRRENRSSPRPTGR